MSGWTPVNKSSPVQHTNHQMEEPKNYEPIDFDMPPPAPKRKRQARKTSPKKREAKIPRLDSNHLQASKAASKNSKKPTKKCLTTESSTIQNHVPIQGPADMSTSYSRNQLEAFKYKGPQVRSTGRGQLSEHPLQPKKRTLEDFQPACPNASPQQSDGPEDFFGELDSQDMVDLEKATRKLSTEERFHETVMPVEAVPSSKRPSTIRRRTTTTDYFAELGEDDVIFRLEDLSESQLYYDGEHQEDETISASKRPKIDSQSQNLAPSNSQRTRTGWASPVRGITPEELQASNITSYPATRNFTRATASPPFRPDYPSDPGRDYQVEDYFSGQGHIYTKSYHPEELASLIEEAEGWNAGREETFADELEPPTSGGFEFTAPFGHETTLEKATLKAQSSFTSLSSLNTDPPKTVPEEPTPKKRTRKRALITPTHYPTNPNSPIRIYCHPNSSPKPPITDYVTKKPRYNDFKIRAIDSGTEAHDRLQRYLNPNEAAEKAAEASKFKPFVRPPFPEPVKDRSPVEGLFGKDRVRACFRIGEVVRLINAGWDGYVEVYDYTFRTPLDRQIFRLHDLFHSNPPYLTAHYDLYTQSEQWEIDSAFFLTDSDSGHAHPTAPVEKKIARIVGKGRKIETPGKDGKKEVDHVLDIVRIWPASEEDVTWVRRIVCGEGKKTN